MHRWFGVSESNELKLSDNWILDGSLHQMKRVVLEMTDVSIEFSGVYALRNMHFSLQESEVHALIGENGAGKSSLIKILGGITGGCNK